LACDGRFLLTIDAKKDFMHHAISQVWKLLISAVPKSSESTDGIGSVRSNGANGVLQDGDSNTVNNIGQVDNNKANARNSDGFDISGVGNELRNNRRFGCEPTSVLMFPPSTEKHAWVAYQ
jgi:hypothetical protein